MSDALELRHDLRFEVNVKNNLLYNAIFGTYGSVNALCEAHEELKGKGTIIGALLRFKAHPFKKKHDRGGFVYYSSEYRTVCLLLERILRKLVEELFPLNLYDHFLENVSERVIELDSFSALPQLTRKKIELLCISNEKPPEERVDKILLQERLEQVMKEELKYREREIVKLRYGIPDGYTLTLDEVAAFFKITRERVRQIEVKAIRKLQAFEAFIEPI